MEPGSWKDPDYLTLYHSFFEDWGEKGAHNY
jgi:hypothetical protein